MGTPLTKKQKKDLVRGLGKLAKAFVQGASARKARPAPADTNLAGTPAPKPGCGPCGKRK